MLFRNIILILLILGLTSALWADTSCERYSAIERIVKLKDLTVQQQIVDLFGEPHKISAIEAGIVWHYYIKPEDFISSEGYAKLKHGQETVPFFLDILFDDKQIIQNYSCTQVKN